MMVQHKNVVRRFHRASALAVLLAAGAAASGCSHSDPASVPAANVPSAAAPMTAAPPAGEPRDPHMSPMSPEDQAMMKQNDAKDKGAPPP